MPITLMPGMTLEQQIEGTRRAIRSLQSRKQGPIWLIPSLEKRLRHLLAENRWRKNANRIKSRTAGGRSEKATRKKVDR
jgi:hypothetical protein